MKKLDMQSKNILKENIEKIEEIFPQVIYIDENGNKKVNFESLSQELSDYIIEGKERYELTWPGKNEAKYTANIPTSETLRPCIEESKDFENTKNIYIKGDNLAVLKILQESYLSKVRFIYIDPPYNTGNDFIYNDEISKKTVDELIESGQIDEEGNKLIANTKTNGRFHSDWLSMMYSRLILAKKLLTDDGVMFISIDDNEYDNLKKICDELFGRENCLGTMVRKTKLTSNKGTFFSPSHEYVLVYSKKIENVEEFNDEEAQEDEKYKKLFKYEDEIGKYNLVSLYMPSLDPRPNQRYYITCPDGSKVIGQEGKMFRWTPETLKKNIDENRVVFLKTDTSPLLDENGNQAKWNVYTKLYLHERQEKGLKPVTFFDKYPNSIASKELIKMNIPFDFSKPRQLIEYFMKIARIKDNDIVMDFFSGSATTAHAVMQLNAERKNGKIKYIMVQLDEKCDENSEAKKMGYENICQVGLERIRKAGLNIKTETDADIDYGYRVFKVDTSNMKDVYYKPIKLKQEQLALFETNIKEDRTKEDLLTQVMLDLGFTLDLKIEEKSILSNKVFYVEDNSLVACFDDQIDNKTIDEICKSKPFKIIFKESSFKYDSDKLNIFERIRKLSPETQINII